MMNLATQNKTTVVSVDWLTPTNFGEAQQLAGMLAQSEMVPQSFRNKPLDIIVAMAMGNELGFRPLQSLQNIAVVNGRPSVWGDAFRALIIGSPDLESIEEHFDESTQTATCKIGRRLASGNVATFTGSFSMSEAQAAGLTGRDPWKKYPKRMLQWRALGYAGRDAYPDRLRGIWIEAEAADLPPEKEINPVEGSAQPAEASQPVKRRRGAAAGTTSKPETKSRTLDAIVGNAAEMSTTAQAYIEAVRTAESLQILQQVYTDVATASRAGEFNDAERAALTEAYQTQKAALMEQAARDDGSN